MIAFPVVSEIEQAIRFMEGPPQADELHGQCLRIAHATATVLHRRGLRPVIQAGSMQWPRMRREEDDGTCSTHFAYMWDPHSRQSQLSAALGNLPEMHVWVGLVETQEMIDFSTRHFRSHAESLGLQWTADDPPPYLWNTADAWPDWVVYTPNLEATLYACRILNRLYHPKYLERQNG
jgi:hypothetical protein